MTKLSSRSWTAVALIAMAGVWYFFRPELAFVDTSIDERAPADVAAVTHRGEFRSVAHETTGTATVLQRASGQRLLRLSPFETSNGPDVHVCMVGADEALDSSSVREAGLLCLDRMKANEGSQNYRLPDDLDLDRYRTVSVWCRRFGVNFGSASLVRLRP